MDAVARNIIAAEGFGDHFGHSLGHGTGLAVHENPRLSPVKNDRLEAGMIVTVEPGVYLPGWGGVRMENQVVVMPNGIQIPFPVDSFARTCLMQGTDQLDYLISFDAEITRFEKQQALTTATG